MDQLVGRPAIAAPSGFTVEGLDRCIWSYQADPSRYVSLTVGPAQTHASSIDAFGAGESVGGVGQDGRWWPLLRTLSVVDGDRAFQVILTLNEPDAWEELALGIARSVLENLPAR